MNEVIIWTFTVSIITRSLDPCWKTPLDHLKLQRMKRDYNRAAHELAQFAKSSGISQQWVGIAPPFIRQALLLDRAKC